MIYIYTKDIQTPDGYILRLRTYDEEIVNSALNYYRSQGYEFSTIYYNNDGTKEYFLIRR